ncbi:hypothetical protein ACFVS2_25140 [Brevibacillus sp. NPDC058079]|uniref:hypothetical protein n=1 Tax=Brevibacillus sp. NPDC058079 TaxID=3346330 RepID=UPI0036EC5AFF
MRSAEETLILFKQTLEKRRAYIRRRLKKLEEAESQYVSKNRKGDRGRTPTKYKGLISLRGGMLSELTTVTGILTAIEKGEWHPDALYNEVDDPIDPC